MIAATMRGGTESRGHTDPVNGTLVVASTLSMNNGHVRADQAWT
jgi:hypothetical protein